MWDWLIVAGLSNVWSDRTVMLATQCMWISWWVYTAGVGYTRATAEDGEMRNRFGEEWERYLTKARYRFVPGFV